jgi:predicted CXXCH cytochrome family protein
LPNITMQHGLIPLLAVFLAVWRGLALAGEPSFVANATCAECHGDIFKHWQASHHAKAMQPATAETVLGDFNDARFVGNGVESRFFERDGRFFIHTQGADGQYADFEAKYTFGITPLQQYLLAMPEPACGGEATACAPQDRGPPVGRLQAFTVAWDTLKQRWFSLYPDEKIPPGDPLHWTGRRFTWNSSCAECHSTDLRLNYDAASGRYQTTWADINVSCQSCHGPGSEHLAWTRNQKAPSAHKGWATDIKTLKAPAQVEVCAACHARRYPISPNDPPGGAFLDDFMPELLREGLYHPDGQMQDEVFNYGSFLQSKMYQRGVGCLDCHEPHTLATRQPGNALCTGCHQPKPPRQRFPSLAAKAYDTPAHHFHQPGSAGAECMNCHAPTQAYMVVDPRHDHSFRIPRPDLSRSLGVPNACTQCHAERGSDWAEAKMLEWHGQGWRKPHYGETLAAGRKGQEDALPALAALAKNKDQPAIVRASAADLLRGYGEPGHAALVGLLADSSPLVKAMAAEGMGGPLDAKEAAALSRLLKDPARAVRIQAARALAAITPSLQGKLDRTALDKALAEYQAAQTAVADQPEGYANLGVLYAATGQPGLAEQAYRSAIRLDPGFYQAYSNLANFYHGQGRQADAEATFRAGILAAPKQGSLHYALGLLLAGQQRWNDALEALSQAAGLMPNEFRVHYNHGLLLQKLGRLGPAETALKHAAELSPEDPDALYALAAFYVQQRRPEAAYPYAERLYRRYPKVPAFQRFFESLSPAAR